MSDKAKYFLILFGCFVVLILVALTNDEDEGYTPMTEKEKSNQEWLINVYGGN